MREFEEQRDSANRSELIERMERLTRIDGVTEPVDGLRVTRASRPTERLIGVSRPSLCVVAQGAKEIFVGDKRYAYDADHYLIATLEVPVTGRVFLASAERPYLCIRIDFEPSLISSVMVESGIPLPPNGADARAVYVSRTEPALLDAVVRMLRTLDSSEERAALLPLIKREMVFRLLMGEQGGRLRHLPTLGSHSHRIAKAVQKLRSEFDQPVSIDGLARDLGMSTSGFHQHFKTVMEVSPLQFQKLIRLQEARRLMLGENLDASSAGYRVGYEDPSHFSRDYKKHFGDSPVRDVAKLRDMVAAD